MATIFILVSFLSVSVLSVTGQTTNKSQLIVTTILHEPYITKDENGELQGFIVDILDKVMRKIGRTYKLHLVKDGKYGALGADGKWNGMVGEIVRGEADLAAAALTMTSIRKAHIDYSFPFLINSLSVVMRRSDIFGTTSEAIFGMTYFLTPFSVGVWLLIIVSFLVVSLAFILLNIFNPYEWRQRMQRGEIKDLEETDDQFGVKESLWFSFSVLLLQGYSKRPLSVSARVLAVFWMFFTLLVLGSYIALMVRNPNLAINTSDRPSFNMKGLRAFTGVNGHPISAIDGGSTRNYFKTTLNPTKIKIYQNMLKTGFAKTTQDCIDMVKKNGTACVLETASVEYYINRDCELVQFGDSFSPRHYGFVMKQNHELRQAIDRALLELSEEGELNKLKWVWWKLKGGVRCGGSKVGPMPMGVDYQPDPADSFIMTDGLALQSFGGPLIFLLIGLILSGIVCIVEILIYKRYGQTLGVPFATDKEMEHQ